MASHLRVALLGSRGHDMASSLACQTEQEKEEGSMSKKKKQNQDDHNSKDMSLMAYDQYSRWVRWTPFVPKEEIASLVQGVLRGREQHAKGGADQQVLSEAKEAREQIVIALQLLVIHLARRFASRFQSLELLDLIQEGNLGLLYAIDHYPTSGSGNGFLGYASVCIRQGLWQADRKSTRLNSSH